MAAGRLSLRPAAPRERLARLFLLTLLLGLPLALFSARPGREAVTLRAAMPAQGGWQPGHLTARVGQPLRLRLTSDDVVHSFAVGAGPDGRPHPSPEVEIMPGQVTELTLVFDQPGTYTYQCTRWCGPDHWRMRGTIEVTGASSELPAPEPPLYLQLGLDLDAPHPPPAVPARTPSAARSDLPVQSFLDEEIYMTASPAGAWLALRARPELARLDDVALWDAVAAFWHAQATPEALALGARLYRRDCAACHGENGAGDGVFARTGGAQDLALRGHALEPATDFTNPNLLGASNVLLQGKIIRGGMGTGMPAWGSVYAKEELAALLAHLWTFQFPRPAH